MEGAANTQFIENRKDGVADGGAVSEGDRQIFAPHRHLRNDEGERR
jgi:hypothetical protein